MKRRVRIQRLLKVDEVIERGDLGRDRDGRYFSMNALAGSTVYDGLKIWRPQRKRRR